jgi:hypothetical protein
VTITKSKLTVLQLVYLPISNHELVWLQSHPEVEPMLCKSDFYLIGWRAEAKFTDFQFNSDASVLNFNAKTAASLVSPVTLNIPELLKRIPVSNNNIEFELSDKLICIWNGPINGKSSKLLEWFTLEKLLWSSLHGSPGICGLESCHEFATYGLLSVGIANEEDSLERLINKGHKAHQEILSNEFQRFRGASETDEIYIFLFKANPLTFKTFDSNPVFTGRDFRDDANEYKCIIANAEKSFESLLKPQYPLMLFLNYPRGKDGLCDSDYGRYGYVVGENITFNTTHGRLRGSQDFIKSFVTNDSDAIFVKGNEAFFYRI